MFGTGVVVPPPAVFTVPVPVQVSVKLALVPEIAVEPVSFREEKVPVYPAYVPVPPVMVKDPVSVPLRAPLANVKVPVSVLPAVTVIVKGAGVELVKETVLVNVPFPE
jgi:hypothetical protein